MHDRRVSAWLEEGISLPVFIVNAIVRTYMYAVHTPMCPSIETK